MQRARNDCFNTLHDEFFLIRPKLRFHKNPRPRQVTALTNQPNREEGIRVMEDKRVVQFSRVRVVFFPGIPMTFYAFQRKN